MEQDHNLKEIKEDELEHIAEQINIDKELLYIKYAKRLLNAILKEFNVSAPPTVSIETKKSTLSEDMMKIVTESNAIYNIIYDVFSDVRVEPEDFYEYYLSYMSKDGMIHIIAKSEGDRMLEDFMYNTADIMSRNKRIEERMEELFSGSINNAMSSKDVLSKVFDGIVKKAENMKPEKE